MLKGLFWSSIEKYSGIFISLIISAILARLVSPEDFGIIAIATVIINFLTLFTTMGIFPAIIQRKDLTSQNLDSIFTFTIIGGTILTLIFFSLSWLIADFYNNNILISVCQILSINLFFASLNLVPSALMAKNKRFKDIAKRTLIIQIISGTISIIAAYNGLGIYALLIPPIVTSIGMLFYNLHFYPRRIDFTFDTTPLKKIFSYSAYQFLFDFINYFSRNLDKLIIGRYINMSALGYYDKSYRLMLIPLQNISAVINPVMQPVLSSLQDDKQEIAKKYNKIIKFIATISFPLAAFLFFTSHELINIVYGNNWNLAIPAFQILSLSLPLQMILTTSGAIYQTANATKYQFYVGIRNTFFTILGFIIACIIFRTIEAVAWAWVITQLLCFISSYTTLYRKVLLSPLTEILKLLKKPLLNGCLIMFCLFWLNNLNITCNIYILFIIKFLTSLFITLIFIQLSKQYDIIEVLRERSIYK